MILGRNIHFARLIAVWHSGSTHAVDYDWYPRVSIARAINRICSRVYSLARSNILAHNTRSNFSFSSMNIIAASCRRWRGCLPGETVITAAVDKARLCASLSRAVRKNRFACESAPLNDRDFKCASRNDQSLVNNFVELNWTEELLWRFQIFLSCHA